MKTHPDVSTANIGAIESINEVISVYKIHVEKSGQLVIDDEADRPEMVGALRGMYQVNRAATLYGHKTEGYLWIAIESGKYGEKMSIVREAFGEELSEKMLEYYAPKATICRRWHDKWQMDKSWNYHRTHFPEDVEREKSEKLSFIPGNSIIEAKIVGEQKTVEVIYNQRDGFIDLYAIDKSTGEFVNIEMPPKSIEMAAKNAKRKDAKKFPESYGRAYMYGAGLVVKQ